MNYPTPTLFQHKRRPDWGMAIIAWERDGKRGYLFESGMLRALAEDFYKFMVPVEDQEGNRGTLDRLLAQVDTAEPGALTARTSVAPALRFSVAEQVALFKLDYENGFEGAWEKKMRGAGAKRRLKRHRDAAINEARTALSSDFFEQCITSGNFEDAWLKVIEVLENTDLVPSGQTQALKAVVSKATSNSVVAIADLLYGQDDPSARFDTHVAALQSMLGKAPSWELTTATLALVHPDQHVCVRRTSFQTQSDWLMPELKGNKRVCAVSYGGFIHLAKTVNDQVVSAGITPHDLLDVHDFIKATTSPSAQSRMLKEREDSNGGDNSKSDGDPAAAA